MFVTRKESIMYLEACKSPELEGRVFGNLMVDMQGHCLDKAEI